MTEEIWEEKNIESIPFEYDIILKDSNFEINGYIDVFKYIDREPYIRIKGNLKDFYEFVKSNVDEIYSVIMEFGFREICFCEERDLLPEIEDDFWDRFRDLFIDLREERNETNRIV